MKHSSFTFFSLVRLVTVCLLCFNGPLLIGQNPSSSKRFEELIRPVLVERCYSCHANGESEGGVSLDSTAFLNGTEEQAIFWFRVLKQLQAGLMPPREEPRPDHHQIALVMDWIKRGPLGLNPDTPDPGKVTVRRLNRFEYRNTIKDLLGLDYNASAAFPADDTGHGFDNIGDVLSISPLLLEKYVDAASEIVRKAVPNTSEVVKTESVSGGRFQLALKPTDESQPVPTSESPERGFGRGNGSGGKQSGDARGRRSQDPIGSLELSYYEFNEARYQLSVEQPADYRLQLTLRAEETYVDNQFDQNKCEFTFSVDGEQLLQREFVRQGGKEFTFSFDRAFQSGNHELIVAVKPISSEEKIRNLRLNFKSIELIGPLDPKYFVKPNDYDRFFPKPIPRDDADRRQYAMELLGDFATRAFRRPVENMVMNRLVAIAERVSGSGKSFESGIGAAMTAVLASPRFLFREEFVMTASEDVFPLIDEYSLAARLSYLLWSSMPDAELTKVAAAGQLRVELDRQVDRMLTDAKSRAFYESFVGQWLQSRAIETTQVNARSVLRREQSVDSTADSGRRRYFELLRKGDGRTDEEKTEFEAAKTIFGSNSRRGTSIDLTQEIRRAMRRETEMLFEHLVREEKSLLELIDSNYTFLNEPLANYYQIVGVQGNEMRRVELPADSLRGGLLTQGTFLAVTSNPDRTSPVKRGLFILENLLGIPTGAPPPDIPPLEEESNGRRTVTHTLRESLAIHRENAVCASCHNRMDPLGLAFENFNAIGRFRDNEFGQKIDAAGILATGESFQTIRDLKKTLVENRKDDIYYCSTEKLLTYALGRAVDYHDTITMDRIVADLKANGGNAKTLLLGVIKSDAFQRTRTNKASPALTSNHK